MGYTAKLPKAPLVYGHVLNHRKCMGTPVKVGAHTVKGLNKEAARILVIMEATGEFPVEVSILAENDGQREVEKILK